MHSVVQMPTGLSSLSVEISVHFDFGPVVFSRGPMMVVCVSHSRNVPVVALRVIRYTRQLGAIGVCRSAVVYGMVQGLTSFFDMSGYISSVMLTCDLPACSKLFISALALSTL